MMHAILMQETKRQLYIEKLKAKPFEALHVHGAMDFPRNQSQNLIFQSKKGRW